MPQNESLSREELLNKLNLISNLYEKAKQIQEEMDSFVPEDYYVRDVVVPEFPGQYETEKQRALWREKLDHTYAGAVELAERTHREVYSPKEPAKPKLTKFVKPQNHELQEKLTKSKNRFYVGAGVGIFFFLGIFSCMLSGDWDVLPFVTIVALAGAAAFWFFHKKYNETKLVEEKQIAEALDAHNRQQDEIKAEYAKNMKAYEGEIAVYEEKLSKFLEEYAAWREIFIASQKEERLIKDQLEKDRQTAVEKIYKETLQPVLDALNEENDLVSKEYLPVLRIITDLLRSGRADGLKEAINLYEEIVYRERQLQLQREQEAQRRYEEEQRRQAEERRYQEEKKFREDQERQRQREEERRQQEAERRHREEMAQRDRMERDRQNEERRRAEEDRRRADRAELDRKQREDRDTRDQCNRCAQVSHCSMAFRRPNCASFRPR